MNTGSGPAQPPPSPLAASAEEVERHVAAAGWDQPLRLFALVRTQALAAAEPSLAARLTDDGSTGDLTAIEQEGLPSSSSVESLLRRLAWPPEVDGVALALERLVLPPEAERDLPQDPAAALDVLASHPDRADVRLLVAVLRDGESVCLLRQRAHDSDDRVASGHDIAPGLIQALQATLLEDH